MADIFISYSKATSQPTIELASALSVLGYSVWWDSSLLGGDEFPVEIQRQIIEASVVIVIWTKSSIRSKWVYSEALLGDRLGKLLPLRDLDIEEIDIPVPFSAVNTLLLSDRDRLLAELIKRKAHPRNRDGDKEHPSEPANFRQTLSRLFLGERSKGQPFRGEPVMCEDAGVLSGLLDYYRANISILPDGKTAVVETYSDYYLFRLDTLKFVSKTPQDSEVGKSIKSSLSPNSPPADQQEAARDCRFHYLDPGDAKRRYGHGHKSEIEILRGEDLGLPTAIGVFMAKPLSVRLSRTKRKLVIFPDGERPFLLDPANLDQEDIYCPVMSNAALELEDCNVMTDGENLFQVHIEPFSVQTISNDPTLSEGLRVEYLSLVGHLLVSKSTIYQVDPTDRKVRTLLTAAALPPSAPFRVGELLPFEVLSLSSIGFQEQYEESSKCFRAFFVEMPTGRLVCNLGGRWFSNMYISDGKQFVVIDRRPEAGRSGEVLSRLQQRGDSPLELWDISSNKKLAEFGTEYEMDVCAIADHAHFGLKWIGMDRCFITPGRGNVPLIMWNF